MDQKNEEIKQKLKRKQEHRLKKQALTGVIKTQDDRLTFIDKEIEHNIIFFGANFKKYQEEYEGVMKEIELNEKVLKQKQRLSKK